MKEIMLSDGSNMLVDDADYEELSKYSWGVRISGKKKYAYRMVNLSRDLLGVKDKNIVVDHINGNSLDNRRENLRIATPSQNQWNKKISKRPESGFRGVYRNYNGWQARLKKGGKLIELGTYDTPEEAYKEWKKEAIKIRGEFFVE